MKLGLDVEMEISERFLPFGITWSLGGLLWTSVLNSALPPQRHSPDAWLEHQEPFIHTAQSKREKKIERKKERKRIKYSEVK